MDRDPSLLSLTWIEHGRIAAMARPSPQDIVAMARMGLTALLSLTEEASNIGRAARAEGMDWYHLPIEDFGTPSLAQVDEAVAFMHDALRRGAVAVHCGAGLGRTGAIIACYLVATGVSPDAAIARVRRARPGSVETKAQEDLVRRYALHRMEAARPRE